MRCLMLLLLLLLNLSLLLLGIGRWIVGGHLSRLLELIPSRRARELSLGAHRILSPVRCSRQFPFLNLPNTSR